MKLPFPISVDASSLGAISVRGRRVKFTGTGAVTLTDGGGHVVGPHDAEILFPAGYASSLSVPALWALSGETFDNTRDCLLSLTAYDASTVAAQIRYVEIR